MELKVVIDMRTPDSENHELSLEQADQDIIELQAIKFAKEFSGLYKSEKKKREELQILSDELKERNEELMDIVFLTSNRFLEPINKIASNFSFIKEHVDASQVGLMEYFEETQKSLDRLHQLVNEMSKLYRVKSLRSQFRPVSLDKVMAEVLQDMEAVLKRKQTAVHVEPLPVLETDSVQLRILFQQLIMLGIRYQWAGEPPVLNVKAARNARGFWRITLVSEGIDFWEHDFGFENYDRQNELDRSLHLCQRICQRLDGFMYGERGSEKSFSCHVVLPEKNIPQASHLKAWTGDF